MSILLIKRLPRVRLAMVSMTVLAASMLVLGAVYYFKQFEQNPALKILPLIFVPCYMFSYGAGKVLLK